MADWTEETIAKLRTLWAEDHSLSEIGRRMRISKNAVVGKAHRLGLPSRPSPIKRRENSSPEQKPVKRAPKTTLPPMLSQEHPTASLACNTPTPIQKARSGRIEECCWPIGDPGTKAFRFCGDASLPGRNYCQEHHGIAFVSPRALVRVAAPLPKIEAYAAANLVRVPPATGLQGLLVAVNKHRRGAGLIPFTLRAGADA